TSPAAAPPIACSRRSHPGRRWVRWNRRRTTAAWRRRRPRARAPEGPLRRMKTYGSWRFLALGDVELDAPVVLPTLVRFVRVDGPIRPIPRGAEALLGHAVRD